MISLIVLGASGLIAACGGSGPAAGASDLKSPFALSKCMRNHGVSGFPDPRSGPGGGGVGFPGGLGVEGPGRMVVMGIPFDGPAVKSAMKACAAGLPPGGPTPAIPPAQRAAMVANAQCMRTHGVPNFPDPTFPGRGAVNINLGSGVDLESPAFQAAQKACRAQLKRSVDTSAGVPEGP